MSFYTQSDDEDEEEAYIRDNDHFVNPTPIISPKTESQDEWEKGKYHSNDTHHEPLSSPLQQTQDKHNDHHHHHYHRHQQQENQQPLYEQFGAPTILYPHTYFTSRTNPIQNDLSEYIRARILHHNVSKSYQYRKNKSQHNQTQKQTSDESYEKLDPTLQREVDYFNRLNDGCNQYWKETHDAKPLDYGNCLLILTCRPNPDLDHPNIMKSNAEHQADLRTPSDAFFMVHPTGRALDFVSVTRLMLPGQKDIDCKITGKANISIGKRVRQIVQCGGIYRPTSDLKNRTFVESCNFYEYHFVVRTAFEHVLLHCTIQFHTSSTDDISCEIQLEQVSTIAQSYNVETLYCAGYTYPTSSDPYWMAPIAPPSFAFLEKHENSQNNNYLYHNLYHNDMSTETQKHVFPSLANLKLLEYTSHPYLIWSAASSAHAPYGGRSASSSLHRLDLRCNQSAFAFSPSNSSHFIEGAIGITGIQCSSKEEHSLYVTTNMREVVELDGRMPGPVKVVGIWSLNGLTEGVFGADLGNDLLQVIEDEEERNFNREDNRDGYGPFGYEKEKRNRVALSVSQKNGAFGFGLYQKAQVQPRFGTLPLETGVSIDATLPENAEGFGSGSILRNVLFPLVDQSYANVFHCGLAHLSIPLSDPHFIPNFDSHFHKQIPSSYIPSNSHALIVFTMTNMGNIYCHTLLKCNRSMKRKSILFPNLPHGVRAIPIPKECCSLTKDYFENESQYVSHMDDILSTFIKNNKAGVYIRQIESSENHANDGDDDEDMQQENTCNILNLELCNRYPQPGAAIFFPESKPFYDFKRRARFPPRLGVKNLHRYEDESSTISSHSKGFIDKDNGKIIKMLLHYMEEAPRTLYEIRCFLSGKNVDVNTEFETYDEFKDWIQEITESDEKRVVVKQTATFPWKRSNSFDEERLGKSKIFHPNTNQGIGNIHIKSNTDDNTNISNAEEIKRDDSSSYFKSGTPNGIAISQEHINIVYSAAYGKKLDKKCFFTEDENEEIDHAEMILSDKPRSDMPMSKIAFFESNWDEEIDVEEDHTQTKKEESESSFEVL